MRRSALLVLALLAAALTATAALAHSWPGRPQTKPPLLGQAGPPPAWLETRQRSRWMSFSSYCWRSGGKAVCVDMQPVQMRTDLGVLRTVRGERLRLHLAFRPRQAHLTVYRSLGFKHYRLSPARLMTWRVRAFGVVVLDVKPAAGTASYAIRLKTR
jgi:hypothetical protein